MPAAARVFAKAALALAAFTVPALAQTDLHQTFLNPPADAKPMVRWWWFGPAVTPEEIRHEINQMHAGGFGGFELASVYPLALDDPAKGIHNLRYTSPEMVNMLRVAEQHGRELGMRVDLTLGSGWPFGGPHIPLELAAGRLKLVAIAANDQTRRFELQPGERLLAKFVAEGTPEHWTHAAPKEIYGEPHPDANGKVRQTNRILDYGAGQPHDVNLYFILSHTKQQVKRAAVGGEGYVLDHMSRAAIDTHNAAVSDKLLAGFAGDKPPYAVFSDSLEVYGSDWTPTLPEEFRKRRGYDLLPHLAELWQGGTPQAEAVRHDWGVTLSDLVRDNYLKPMAAFATAHGTQFRSQTYGEPAATLSDEAAPQLAEGEGPQWNQFSFTRWASSANHIFGRTITSAETWTWLHSPAFRATPLDMKVEADRMFLEGVNQVIGHGWPYSPPVAEAPGYSLYAAAVFNAHNPWWPVMPAVTRYLQRVSWLLRQGEPANAVAILLPEDDAQAAFVPGHVSVTEEMKRRITPAIMQAVLATGNNVDYIDGPALEAHTIPHHVIVVPPTTRMRLQTAQALERYQQRGGKILFLGETPTLAPGLQDTADTPRLVATLARILPHASHADAAQFQPTLQFLAPAAFNVDGTDGNVGFIQRRLPHQDVYFVANTSPEPRTFRLHVTSAHHTLTWWEIEQDRTTPAVDGESVTLPPYGSRVLSATDTPHHGSHHQSAIAAEQNARTLNTVTLTNWTAAYPGSETSPALPTVTDAATDTTANPTTRFYSGEVRFTAQANLSPGEAQGQGPDTPQQRRKQRTGRTAFSPTTHTELRFAPGTALPDTQPANKPGTRAWFDAPIRDAATIFINGKEAGVLWHPPYTLDVTGLVHPGENTVEVRVDNTAINSLAGQPPRDYTALKAKYGDRFQPQDMDHLQPAPSGIFGPVELVTTTAPAH